MEIHELMTLGREVFCLAIPGNFLVLHEQLLGRLKAATNTFPDCVGFESHVMSPGGMGSWAFPPDLMTAWTQEVTRTPDSAESILLFSIPISR